jgi:hypothetical protein
MKFTRMQNKLCSSSRQATEHTHQYRFAPKRWCTSVTVMIEKDPGNPRIERLRVIHLFEADYNLSLKLGTTLGKKNGLSRRR